MPLIVPTLQDYDEAEQKIIEFFWDVEFFRRVNQKVDYIIYGSYSTDKVRPWLSDIDMMILAHTDDLVFPFDVWTAFAWTKWEIEQLGIPLQVNMCTTGLLNSQHFSPDYEYLMEVKKWIERWKTSSNNIWKYFKNHRDSDIDDMHMVRYFLRKVNSLYQDFRNIDHLIMRYSKEDLNREQQKKVWHAWDNFKKMMSIITVVLRIQNKESLFSETDAHIMEKFSQNFDQDIDMSEYVVILESIQDIWDWYDFLQSSKDDGFRRIIDLYKNTFTPMINTIDKKLLLPTDSNI